MNEAVQDAMNDQIKHELYSAYLYLSMSVWCESANLPGAAYWMRTQAEEEVEHAMKFFDHILERRGQVTLQAIEQPPAEFDSLLEIFQGAFEHEQKVTGLINDIYDLAVEEKDYPAQALLQWFADEQVEEEMITGDVVEKIKMIGDSSSALYMLDKELGEREPQAD